MPPRKKAPSATQEVTGGNPDQTGTDKMAVALAQIKKIFNDSEAINDIDEEDRKSSHPVINSGSLVLDYLIGGRPNRHNVPSCPGYPKGKVINLYGPQSSGKSTLALTAGLMAIEAGGTVGYIDAENAFDLRYAESLGIPITDRKRFVHVLPENFEEGAGIALAMAKAGVDIIVFDSVMAGMPKALTDEEIMRGDFGRIGYIAQFWSRALSSFKKVCRESGSTFIGISQLRQKINTGGTAYPGQETTAPQGGESWKFNSDLRLNLKAIGDEKIKMYNPITNEEEEVPVLQKVRVKVDKSRVSSSQGHSANIYIRRGTGIDDIRSVIDVAIAHGIVKKSGSWVVYEYAGGEAIKVQGLETFWRALRKNKTAWEELASKVLDRMIVASSEQAGGDDDEE